MGCNTHFSRFSAMYGQRRTIFTHQKEKEKKVPCILGSISMHVSDVTSMVKTS